MRRSRKKLPREMDVARLWMLVLAMMTVGCQQQARPPVADDATSASSLPITESAQPPADTSEAPKPEAASSTPATQTPATTEQTLAEATATQAESQAVVADPDEPQEQIVEEIWESIFLRGAKVGYAHSTVKQAGAGDDAQRLFEQEMNTELRRAGDAVDLEIKLASVETLDGELISFTGSVLLGPTPQVFVGTVDGDELRLETTTAGRTATTTIPWDGTAGGFMAVEDSLRATPMQPGEKRKLKVLAPPPLVQVTEIELEAGEFEDTELPGGTFRLLRIDQSIDFGTGQPIRSTMWIDDAGVVVKTEVASMGEVHFRTTPELARAANQVAEVDLLTDQAIPLEKPILNAHRIEHARYRVTLAGGNPLNAFHEGTGQTMEAVDEHTMLLTVDAVRADSDLAHVPEATALPEDIEPNQLIQSDDPRVIALAESVDVEDNDQLALALSLERVVHNAITQRNFTQAFASAAAVAENLEGDCTEHAVLLAALARARGIPARVAVGLVYVDSLGGFGYHMWTEVLVNGHWLPLDATLGEGGIGAAHLKLADTNLAGQSAYLSLLPVAQVLGQLKIELIEAE